MPTVLIIDSDAEASKALETELTERGVQTKITGDGAEGLEKARSDRPDAIVLCVELNRMSGYSICNKLKKDAELAKIPLILTSSQATEETFQQHKKLKTRADQYLRRPYEQEQMLGLLAQYIDFSGGEEEEAELDVSMIDIEDEEESGDDQDGDAELGDIELSVEDDAAQSLTPALAAHPSAADSSLDPLLELASIEESMPARSAAPISTASGDLDNEGLQTDLRRLRQRVAQLEQQQQEKELEYQDRILQESTRSREAVELKKKLAQVEREIDKHNQAAEKAKQEAQEALAQAEELRQQAEAANAERDVLSDKLGQLVDKVKALAAEREVLRGQVDSQEKARQDVEEQMLHATKLREKAKKAVDIAVQLLDETGLVH
ncbi:MAG: response regulator [Myxococcota bacterium]